MRLIKHKNIQIRVQKLLVIYVANWMSVVMVVYCTVKKMRREKKKDQKKLEKNMMKKNMA